MAAPARVMDANAGIGDRFSVAQHFILREISFFAKFHSLRTMAFASR
jgi:hypothetical protein